MGLPASQSRYCGSSGVYASRVSRWTAEVVVSAIRSRNGGAAPASRLLDDRPHPLYCAFAHPLTLAASVGTVKGCTGAGSPGWARVIP